MYGSCYVIQDAASVHVDTNKELKLKRRMGIKYFRFGLFRSQTPAFYVNIEPVVNDLKLEYWTTILLQ